MAAPEVPEDGSGVDPQATAALAPADDQMRSVVNHVIDGIIGIAESVAMILRLSGCTYDGVSALDAAKVYHPDVVVLDIGLPGISGNEVARRLRLEPEFRATPLVAVTGHGRDVDRRRSERAGIDYHLTKPVDPATLQQLLARSPARGKAH